MALFFSGNLLILIFLMLATSEVNAQCKVNPPTGHPWCKYRDLCLDSSGEIRLNISWSHYLLRNCFCYERCGLYGDCCKNYVSGLKPLPDNTFVCAKKESIFSYNVPLWMVDRCPAEWQDKKTREKCESPDAGAFAEWPVSGMQQVVFTNIFCSRCHGQPINAFWKAVFRCDVTEEISKEGDDIVKVIAKYKATGRCRQQFFSPGADDDIPVCKPYISTCPPEWKAACVRQRCEEPKAPLRLRFVKGKAFTFKNSYCALCHGYQREATCRDTVNAYTPNPYGRWNFALYSPFTIVVDLNVGIARQEHRQGAQVNKKVYTLPKCKNGGLFDPFSGRCWKVCPPGSVWKRTGCRTDKRWLYDEPWK